MIGWGRARGSWWVAIVLPGFLLRSLIPIGFMPTFGPGLSVRLILCEGCRSVASIAVSTAMDLSSDMPMNVPMDVPAQHHPGGDPSSGGSGSRGHQDHSACPYGASPTPAAVPAWSSVLVTMQRSSEPPVSAPQVTHFEIAPRAQSPRGPPVEL